MNKAKIIGKAVLTAMSAYLIMAAPGTAVGSISAYAVTIEYDNLRDLLIAGNQDLKNSSSLTNVKNIETQLEVLKEECQSLAANARIYADDTETAAQYKSSANILNQTITRLEKQLDKQTSDNAAVNTSADSYTKLAQSSMISYLKMESQAEAAEKTAEAAEIKYNNTLTRQAAGAATDTEVTDAYASMLSAKTQAEGFRQQADSLRNTFLDMLGIKDGSDVSISELKEPDAAAIKASINYAQDKTAAVNSDANVKSVRHNRSDSSAEMNIKEASEEEAVSNAESEFDAAYNELQNKLSAYEAAQKGLTAAENTYQGLQRRKSAGMLTKADELNGEAEYISSKADYASAAMDLTAAYEDYKWLKAGIS